MVVLLLEPELQKWSIIMQSSPSLASPCAVRSAAQQRPNNLAVAGTPTCAPGVGSHASAAKLLAVLSYGLQDCKAAEPGATRCSVQRQPHIYSSMLSNTVRNPQTTRGHDQVQ